MPYVMPYNAYKNLAHYNQMVTNYIVQGGNLENSGKLEGIIEHLIYFITLGRLDYGKERNNVFRTFINSIHHSEVSVDADSGDVSLKLYATIPVNNEHTHDPKHPQWGVENIIATARFSRAGLCRVSAQYDPRKNGEGNIALLEDTFDRANSPMDLFHVPQSVNAWSVAQELYCTQREEGATLCKDLLSINDEQFNEAFKVDNLSTLQLYLDNSEALLSKNPVSYTKILGVLRENYEYYTDSTIEQFMDLFLGKYKSQIKKEATIFFELAKLLTEKNYPTKKIIFKMNELIAGDIISENGRLAILGELLLLDYVRYFPSNSEEFMKDAVDFYIANDFINQSNIDGREDVYAGMKKVRSWQEWEEGTHDGSVGARDNNIMILGYCAHHPDLINKFIMPHLKMGLNHSLLVDLSYYYEDNYSRMAPDSRNRAINPEQAKVVNAELYKVQSIKLIIRLFEMVKNDVFSSEEGFNFINGMDNYNRSSPDLFITHPTPVISEGGNTVTEDVM